MPSLCDKGGPAIDPALSWSLPEIHALPPISFWIVVLVLMVVVLVLQDATRYTSSDRFADLLNDAGFGIILIVLLVGAVFNLRLHQRHQYVSLNNVLWIFAAFGCWWLFFRDDSAGPPKK